MTSTLQSFFSVLGRHDHGDDHENSAATKSPTSGRFSHRGSRKGVSPKEPKSSSTSKTPDSQDLQDLNTLARLRCWSAIEQCASTVDSIHHITLTPAGNAPLHSAISNGAPLSTIQALVVASPTSVAVGNNFGNTPLHFAAWKNKYPESSTIVHFLLDFYPQSAKVLNKHGNLPLHHATNYKAHPDIVQLLYRAFPKAVHVRNDKGQTPLDLAIHRLGEKHSVVAMLQGDTRNFVYQHGLLSQSDLVVRHQTKHNYNNQGKPKRRDDDHDNHDVPNDVSPSRLNHKYHYSTSKEDHIAILTDVWDEVDLSK